MILQYLAVALLLFTQILAAQSGEGQAPQGTGNIASQTESPINPYKTLEGASQKAREGFETQLSLFRDEVSKTCNNERIKRERQKILDALKEYDGRESEYLGARINRQKTILDTLQVMHPESAPPAVDLEQIRADLSRTRADLASDEDRYKKTPNPSLEQAILAEKDGIARLEEIIRLSDDENKLDDKAKTDFDEALRLQGIYLKEEEAGLLLLKEETSNWSQYLTSMTAARVLACARQENIGLDRPRLGASPAQQK